jgi:predicted RNase H-like HicB family nuclease
MLVIDCIIEKTSNNYSAYLVGIDGIVGVGKTIGQCVDSILESINILKEDCVKLGCELPTELQGEYQLRIIINELSAVRFA